MAIAPITPRDRLQRLVDSARKTLRYWWLVAAFAVIGGGLSLAFAMTRSHTYQSWTTLFYQEKIQSSVFSQQREETAQRNIGDRYRELLLARDQLMAVIADPKLNPYPDISDSEDAVERLRQAVKFEARGANAFRISYTDQSPQRAMDVTRRLFETLDSKDDQLRKEQAQFTVKFAQNQATEAQTELQKRETNLAGFLFAHPEFAQDPSLTTDLAHSSRTAKPTAPTDKPANARTLALQRQRARLQARLDAPPDAPVVQLPAAPTPEKIAAEQAVQQAQSEVNAAQRELDDANQKYQPAHPTVMRAQEKLAGATQKLRHAQANVPPDSVVEVKPATGEDRVKLQRQIGELDAQIAQESGNKTPTPVPITVDNTAKIVKLESDHAELRRLVNEARGRAEALGNALFRAQIDASQNAESGGRLTVVDQPFKPIRPTGAGKTIILLAGFVLFTMLGLALAVGMAVIDDRLYRSVDVVQLGLPVLAVIPAAQVKHLKKPK